MAHGYLSSWTDSTTNFILNIYHCDFKFVMINCFFIYKSYWQFSKYIAAFSGGCPDKVVRVHFICQSHEYGPSIRILFSIDTTYIYLDQLTLSNRVYTRGVVIMVTPFFPVLDPGISKAKGSFNCEL